MHITHGENLSRSKYLIVLKPSSEGWQASVVNNPEMVEVKAYETSGDWQIGFLSGDPRKGCGCLDWVPIQLVSKQASQKAPAEKIPKKINEILVKYL